MDDEKKDEQQPKKELPPVEPPRSEREFEGLHKLAEDLLMSSKFAANWETKHDDTLGFLAIAAAILHDLGEEGDAEELWNFIESYERPRIHIFLANEVTGPLKFVELGVETKAAESHVPISQGQAWYDRVNQRMFAAAYFQKLAKQQSEAVGLLYRHGVLSKRGVRINPFGALLKKEVTVEEADESDDSSED